VITIWNKKNGTDTLQSVLAICKTDSVKNEGMAIMLFMAAAVEIIEPDGK
jgi:hypothetical protein